MKIDINTVCIDTEEYKYLVTVCERVNVLERLFMEKAHQSEGWTGLKPEEEEVALILEMYEVIDTNESNKAARKADADKRYAEAVSKINKDEEKGEEDG